MLSAAALPNAWYATERGWPVARHAHSSERSLAMPTRALSQAESAPIARSAKRPHTVDYTFRVALDPASHHVRGEGTLRFTNTSSASLGTLRFHAYLNAFEHEATVFMRRSASGFRGAGEPLRDRGRLEVERLVVRELARDVWPKEASSPDDPADRTDVVVPLPRAIAPGETVHLDTAFVAKLPSIVLRTGHAGSFHMVAQWFPKLAKLEPDGRFAGFTFDRFSEFYSDFSDYDVTIDVPDGFVVGATGERVETLDLDGGGRRERHAARDVHDFAFAAWDGFVELRATHGGVRLRALAPAGKEAIAEAELGAASAGLDHFGERFGPYPWPALTVVHPPPDAEQAGGMEYPTLITTGRAQELQPHDARATQLLVLHELAHQWFQGILATNERADPFLDEGLATWASGRAIDALYGGAGPRWGPSLAMASLHRGLRWRAGELGPIAREAPAFATGAEYGALVYRRAATLFETLDRASRGGFARGVERFARTHRFSHPGPDALFDAVRAEAGPRIAEALRAGVMQPLRADVRLVAVEPRTTDRGESVQITIERDGVLDLPVELAITDARDRVERRTWDGPGTRGELVVELDSMVRSVELDPDATWLVDDDLGDRTWVRSAGSTPRLRAAALVAALAIARGVAP
jgi:hypothetical protein